MDNRLIFPQFGIITALDKSENRAKVYLPLFKMETEFIKLSRIPIVQWAVKDEVLVAFANGDINDGVVIARLYSEKSDGSPDELVGDFVFRHKSGVKVHLNDSGVSIEGGTAIYGDVNLADGEKGVARIDDTVEVEVNLNCSCGGSVSGTCTGTIKTGSGKVKAG